MMTSRDGSLARFQSETENLKKREMREEKQRKWWEWNEVELEQQHAFN